MQTETAPIYASPENLKVFSSLITTSYRTSTEVDTILPWAKGVDRSIAPKLPEHSWIYGTKYWDMLSEEQRTEVLWLENARDVTAFIALEKYLPVLYIGYINKYGAQLAPEVYEYLMIFSKEEIVHTLMFQRYMKLANLPLVKDPESPYHKTLEVLAEKPPVYGILFALLVEWVAELNAVFCSQHEVIEPFTKELFHVHHIEEVRHLAFGKRIVEDFVVTASKEELEPLHAMFKPVIASLYAEITYNRAIGDFTSFKFPVDKNDSDAVAAVRNSENNQKINKVRFEEMNDWLERQGFA